MVHQRAKGVLAPPCREAHLLIRPVDPQLRDSEGIDALSSKLAPDSKCRDVILRRREDDVAVGGIVGLNAELSLDPCAYGTRSNVGHAVGRNPPRHAWQL